MTVMVIYGGNGGGGDDDENFENIISISLLLSKIFKEVRECFNKLIN